MDHLSGFKGHDARDAYRPFVCLKEGVENQVIRPVLVPVAQSQPVGVALLLLAVGECEGEDVDTGHRHHEAAGGRVVAIAMVLHHLLELDHAFFINLSIAYSVERNCFLVTT